MSANRDRFMELLQPEPSWRREHLFAMYLRWMAFMGAHTGPIPRYLSPTQKAVRALIGFLHALTIYFLLSEWLEFFLNSNDINAFISKAGVCLTSTCAAFNNFHAVFNSYQLRKIIDALDCYTIAVENLSTDSFGPLSPVLARMKKIDRIIYWYVVGTMMNVGVPTIGSMVTLSPPVRFWHPIDVYSGVPNLIVVLLVNAAGAFWGFNMAAFSATFAKLVLTLCAQLDGLSQRLLRLGTEGDEVEEEERAKERAEEGVARDRMAQEVAEIARRHQELQRILIMVKDFYNPVFFILFVAAAINICCTSYIMMITEIHGLDFFTTAFLLSVQVLQMIMYCWFGEMLSEKASGVGEAAYASSWYNGSVSAQRSLLLVLGQGQRGFMLTAGFIPVTLRTLQQVLETAGSYLMVLLAVGESDRGGADKKVKMEKEE